MYVVTDTLELDQLPIYFIVHLGPNKSQVIRNPNPKLRAGPDTGRIFERFTIVLVLHVQYEKSMR